MNKIVKLIFFTSFVSQSLISFGCSMALSNESLSPTPMVRSTGEPKIAEPTPTQTPVLNLKLESSRSVWRAKNIRNYDLRVSYYEGGLYSFADPALIQVRENEPARISSVKKEANPSLAAFEKVNSVEKMFNLIQHGYDIGAKVEVKYNASFGYPESFTIDDIKHGVDSYMVVKIRRFNVIPLRL